MMQYKIVNNKQQGLQDGINSMHADIIENKKYSAISAYNSQQSVRLQHRQNDILYYRY
mgnify:CR=1 FL=1